MPLDHVGARAEAVAFRHSSPHPRVHTSRTLWDEGQEVRSRGRAGGQPGEVHQGRLDTRPRGWVHLAARAAPGLPRRYSGASQGS